MKRSIRIFPLLVLLYGCATPSSALAAGYTFTNIADTTTPGPVGLLRPLGEPSISGGVVAFGAQYGPSTADGIFAGSGGPVTAIAKRGDLAPIGTFSGFGNSSISSSGVAFRGLYDAGKEGVFLSAGGALTTVAKTGDIAAVGTFASFNYVSMSGDKVAFLGRSDRPPGGPPPVDGIYVGSGGPLTTIAKTGDLAPTGFPFEAVVRPAISGNKVAFTSYDGGTDTAIYVGSGGPLTKIVQPGDPAPGGTFSGGDYPTINNNNVAFGGAYGPSGGPFSTGSFIGNGGIPMVIALVGDPAPFGTFNQIGVVSIHDTSILLNGTYAGFTEAGIFIKDGGPLVNVIKTGDALFGSTATTLGAGLGGLDQDGSGRIAFYYRLSDGRIGIGMATPVPEPATLPICVFGLLMAGLTIRARQE